MVLMIPGRKEFAFLKAIDVTLGKILDSMVIALENILLLQKEDNCILKSFCFNMKNTKLFAEEEISTDFMVFSIYFPFPISHETLPYFSFLMKTF